MANPRLILLVETDSGLSQPHPLRAGHKITIGSAPENRIIVDDRSVSRRHAEIRYESGRLVLVDLGSTNGTFVNGKRVTKLKQPVPIRISDDLAIGHCKIRFQEIDSSSWDTKTAISGFLSLPTPLQQPPHRSDIGASFDLDSGHLSITRKGFTPLDIMIQHGFAVAAMNLDGADDNDVAVVARCTGKRLDSWVRLCAGYVRSLDQESLYDAICHPSGRWVSELLSISFETPTIRLFASVTDAHDDDVSMISGDAVDLLDVLQGVKLMSWLLKTPDAKSRAWLHELLEWVQTNIGSDGEGEAESDLFGVSINEEDEF